MYAAQMDDFLRRVGPGDHTPPAGAPTGRDRPGGAGIVERAVRLGAGDGLKLVLGIDAGGTTTDAVVCTPDGAVVGVGSAGPGNWEEIGVEEAVAAMSSAVRGRRAPSRGRCTPPASRSPASTSPATPSCSSRP